MGRKLKGAAGSSAKQHALLRKMRSLEACSLCREAACEVSAGRKVGRYLSGGESVPLMSKDLREINSTSILTTHEYLQNTWKKCVDLAQGS